MCTERIAKSGAEGAHCTGQYFDYWACVDKCVRARAPTCAPPRPTRRRAAAAHSALCACAGAAAAQVAPKLFAKLK